MQILGVSQTANSEKINLDEKPKGKQLLQLIWNLQDRFLPNDKM